MNNINANDNINKNNILINNIIDNSKNIKENVKDNSKKSNFFDDSNQKIINSNIFFSINRDQSYSKDNENIS